MFLNNDVIFSENTIKTLINYLEKTNDKILIAPRLLNTDGTIQHSVASFQSLWLSFTAYFFLYKLFPKSKYFNRYYLINMGVEETMEVDAVTGAFMILKREEVLSLNGFDENYFFYGEDNDLCKRFRDAGGKIIYFPKTKLTHLKGGTKKTNWFNAKNHTLSVIYLYHKHYPFYKRIVALFLFFLGSLLRATIYLLKYIFTLNRRYLEELKIKLKIIPLIMGFKN